MATNVDISTAVPLILLVSLAITQVCRNTNPTNYTGVKGWRFAPSEWISAPELGAVNYLYLSNNIILYISLSMSVDSYQGNIMETIRGVGPFTTFFVSFIVFIVWIISPILAFDEYQQIPPKEPYGHPDSFRIHFLLVSFMTFYSIILSIVIRVTETPDRIFQASPLRIIGVLSFIFIVIPLFMYGSNLFLRKLENEIDET